MSGNILHCRPWLQEPCLPIGKTVEQAQNRRILTGRLTCAVHPLQTLLLCAQKEEVGQRVRAMEKERSVLVSMALMKGITGFKELKKSRLT